VIDNLPAGVSATFSSTCNTCGATVEVVDGDAVPHTCRIEIP
jgi:hypothetical protein